MRAHDYDDTIKVFKEAGQSGEFFKKSYGYAVFPTIGKGGIGIGGAHGKGRVYVGGKHVGDTSMTQLTAGFQLGGQAFSEIVFFEDKRSFDDSPAATSNSALRSRQLRSRRVPLRAQARRAALRAPGGGKHDAATAGGYHKGTAVFTVAKGGLMYEATVGGQKLLYKAL